MTYAKPIDRFIPWFFVLFFVLLAGLLGWFAYLAISTDRGVVSANAYQQGLNYNAIIEKQNVQDKLGWKGDVTVTASSGVHFSLQEKDGSAVSGATVQLVLVRPTQAGHDITQFLRQTAPGVYEGSVAVSLPGLWEAHITAKRGDKNFQMMKRLTL